jgi:hypothetical protein
MRQSAFGIARGNASASDNVSTNGGEGNVTVVHQESADKYTVVATMETFAGAKTITVDPKTHNVYLRVANSKISQNPRRWRTPKVMRRWAEPVTNAFRSTTPI